METHPAVPRQKLYTMLLYPFLLEAFIILMPVAVVQQVLETLSWVGMTGSTPQWQK